MKKITLTNGGVAFVDDEDYETVVKSKWHLQRVGWSAYARRNGRKDRIFMHQFIMGAKGIDHVDGNGLNNIRSNLRLATSAQNNQNRRKRKDQTTSRYKGVIWEASRNKWRADIKIDGKSKTLGRFKTEEEAAMAYDQAAVEAWDEYARINFDA